MEVTFCPTFCSPEIANLSAANPARKKARKVRSESINCFAGESVLTVRSIDSGLKVNFKVAQVKIRPVSCFSNFGDKLAAMK